MTRILAGKLFDPYTGDLLQNRLITVSPESGLILDVQPFDDSVLETIADLADPNAIVDLRDLTVLPGLVDVHVHCELDFVVHITFGLIHFDRTALVFLHPYSEVSWEDQVTRESIAERTVRATVHARRTLMAGYTAVRDLGTEGAEDADLALRKCISGPNPIAVGPRYFVANRAIAATGSYGPKNKLYPNQTGVQGIYGTEPADGEIECRKAVRRQVGAGADWIKIALNDNLMTDYRFRVNANDVAPQTAGDSIMTFSQGEVAAMVSEAHRLGVKIAAHASNTSTWTELVTNHEQVDTIEHTYGLEEVFEGSPPCAPIKGNKTIWVPTLSVYYLLGQQSGVWDRAKKTFQAAVKAFPKDLHVACGGDTGVFPHGDNAQEMKLMVSLGADWRMVLRWGTLGGWECVRSLRWEGPKGTERLRRVGELREDARLVGDNEVPFGVVVKGFAADIIATNGNLEKDFAGAVDKKNIRFVMKGGKIYKRDGLEVV
ncbi:hypothetical protein PHLCEN_2v12068 [Hermanssonia centrifuga]|uniref:Amidohydrolase-related domain-containing protein n=1 Tax=Hermanssonia centrifuga TaxID=98765 RepID=A0A2R6NIF4_9APHY|nr:hypothetical protein PHLCEN_2v12068 [Hermanssonia centrifuga]